MKSRKHTFALVVLSITFILCLVACGSKPAKITGEVTYILPTANEYVLEIGVNPTEVLYLHTHKKLDTTKTLFNNDTVIVNILQTDAINLSPKDTVTLYCNLSWVSRVINKSCVYSH
jgi:hypothetical protein